MVDWGMDMYVRMDGYWLGYERLGYVHVCEDGWVMVDWGMYMYVRMDGYH